MDSLRGAGTASELIRGAAVRRLELPNRAMAASGQAKRHQSNSDQGAHWGRHGKAFLTVCMEARNWKRGQECPASSWTAPPTLPILATPE